MTTTQISPDRDRDGNVVPLSAPARRAAIEAAETAGMPVNTWLSQLIKYAGRMQEQHRAVDTTSAGQAGDEPVMLPVSALRPGRAGAEGRPDHQEIDTILRAYTQTGDFPPIVARRAAPPAAEAGGAGFEIIGGEQRWRAALKAKLAEVPVLIQDCSDREALIFSVREAVRRRRLNALTEARCYRRLIDDFGLTAGEIADAIGEPVAHVADTIDLLTLPRAVRKMIEDGVLSRPHARALLLAEDPEPLAWEVAGHGLDIYRTEQMVRNANRAAGRRPELDIPRG